MDVPQYFIDSAAKFGCQLFALKDNHQHYTQNDKLFGFSFSTDNNPTWCLVDVYGEGVLLMGESGIGKSETALELIKRP